MKYSYLTLLASIFLYSCSNDKILSEEYENLYKMPTKIEVKKNKKIDVNKFSDIDPAIYQVIEEDTIEYLLIYNKRISGIEVFNLDENSYEKTIKIPLDGPDAPSSPESFFALSLDSIFILSPRSWSLTLYDGNGFKQYKHRFIENVKSEVDRSNFSNIYVIYNNWAYRIGNSIYFPTVEQSPLSDLDRYKKSKLVQSFNLKTKETDFHYGYPDLYENKNYGHLTINHFRTLNNQKKFVHSFSADPNIYLTDYNNLNESFFGGTKLFEGPTELSNSNRDRDNSEYQQARMTSTFYRGILFDKYRNIYYRFAVGPGNKKSPLHQSRYFADISVIVLDANLNWIGETLLNSNTYSYKFWFVTKEGLCISKSHPFNDHVDEDKLNFDVFLPVQDQM